MVCKHSVALQPTYAVSNTFSRSFGHISWGKTFPSSQILHFSGTFEHFFLQISGFGALFSTTGHASFPFVYFPGTFKRSLSLFLHFSRTFEHFPPGTCEHFRPQLPYFPHTPGHALSHAPHFLSTFRHLICRNLCICRGCPSFLDYLLLLRSSNTTSKVNESRDTTSSITGRCMTSPVLGAVV